MSLCLQVYFCASTGTTCTTYPSGLEVVRFPSRRIGQWVTRVLRDPCLPVV